MPVVILLADGVRPDVLEHAIAAGHMPALERLRAEGGAYTVTSCFPSVTGPAYTPFLLGRHPAPLGLPGLRWFDRAREVCTFPDYTRSYVGYQIRAVDDDLDRDARTAFELCPSSVGALNVINRGLAPRNRIGGLTPASAVRAVWTHFRGDVAGWLEIDRGVSAEVARRVRTDRPAFVFAALTGVDKTSHATGQRFEAPVVRDALTIVDQTAAILRQDAERLGYWDDMHLWITSDHGHCAIEGHDDLARTIRGMGHRVMAHPWVYTRKPDVAVMVSGNAMAHLYVELDRRERPLWPALAARWEPLVEDLLARPSVDLAILPRNGGAEVRGGGGRGRAIVGERGGAFTYLRESGDPLGLGRDLHGVSADEAYDVTAATDYPDSLVQIAHVAAARRSGDVILSAARAWDFRGRYEPIHHVSSHGALHRDHMLVPLLLNRPAAQRPRRTVDVLPSALAALGIAQPPGLDGRSFVAPGARR